jgi:Zn-dependent M28 family amino/carboxypeptidase
MNVAQPPFFLFGFFLNATAPKIMTLLLLLGVLLWPTACLTQTVDDVVNQVSQTAYRQYLDDLLYTHSGADRGNGAQHDLARATIYDQFSSFGLQTTLDPFPLWGTTFYNVIGVLPGTGPRSDQVYIVGAHYDSFDNPGADDNASGVAAVLEAAKVLSQQHFDATLVFAAFDREEQGLIGSWNYAFTHQNDDINGMISLDMIANNNDNDLVSIFGRTTSDPIKLALSNSIAMYGNGLATTIGGDQPNSDHAPFEVYGFEACLFMEGNYQNNFFYHNAGDTVDTLGYIDYEFATDITRSTVGFLATEAGLFSAPDAGSTLWLLSGSLGILLGMRRFSRLWLGDLR